ncbi:four helix bundle protein [Sinomicrobium pectinilyticum]|uniref:Four helix bundle protein n=1 Tax=Sinomicrobium pectinilyticum TaxID=1084421 RepID=A0A3N0EZZ0_SINP1|nr:four helix bundle protein [Sinomicrobium pectinilyticum]RNL93446.1 four helix bundle protein [Sinomicrobium pectinilyticum]
MTFNEKYKGNIILVKSFNFAVKVVQYAELPQERRKYVLARQIMKSGTFIGANIKEAQNAESKADFIHKMKIAAKEADETEYWLFLCEAIKSYPHCKELLYEVFKILKILNKIITTSKTGRNYLSEPAANWHIN